MAEIVKMCPECGTPNITLNGINSNTQKLIDQLPNWKGYNKKLRIDCYKAIENLFILAFNRTYPPQALDKQTGISMDQRNIVPTTADIQKAQELLAKNYIVSWQINGAGSGQHWVIMVKFEQRSDGIYATYIDSAPKFTVINRWLVTEKIDKTAYIKNLKIEGVYLGMIPNGQGSSGGLRGQYFIP